MADKYEHMFTVFDPAITSAIGWLNSITDGRWRVAHAVPLSDDRVLLIFERPAVPGV